MVCPGAALGTGQQLALVRAVRASIEARDWHRAGVASLLLASGGQAVDPAIRYLEKAPPEAPGVLSDLAAAYLVRAAVEDDPYDDTLALELADRALVVAPDAEAPRFQRALALTELGLYGQALEDWGWLAADGRRDGWRQEATARLRRLEEPAAAERWERIEERVRRTVDTEATVLDTDELARGYPQQLRVLMEDRLLARWGREVLDGNEETAARVLARLEDLAAGLHRVSGDPTLEDSVAVLAGAKGRDRRALARAHLDYAAARRRHLRQDYATADPLYDRAAAAFTAAGSPFAFWPAYYRAVIQHHRGEYADALRAQRELRRRLPSEALIPRAYSEWMSGLTRQELAHWQESLEHFERAAESFEAAGEVENRVAMEGQVGSQYDSLGQPREAWRYYSAALARRPQLVKNRRVQNLLSFGMRSLLKEGRASVALYFADEWQAVARASGSAVSESLALQGRVDVLAQLDRRDRAASELERAAAAAREIPDRGLRADTEAWVALAQARLLAASDPERALTALATAAAFYRRTGSRQHLVQAQLVRAEIHASRDETTAEASALDAAVDEIERQRDDVTTGSLRISYLDQRRDVMERVVGFEIDRGRPRNAFLLVERMRAPQLRDELKQRRLGGELRPLAELRSELPEGTTVLEFLVLDDRLLTWRLDGSGLSLLQHSVARARLAALVDRFSGIVRDGGDMRDAGNELSDLLLSAAPLHGDGTVVVIPDGPLHDLQFAALPLRDGAARFLIEQSRVVVAPSLNVYLDLAARPSVREADGRPTLVVTGIEHDDRAFPQLAHLGEWRRYDGAMDRSVTFLRGTAATGRAFLQALPLHGAVLFEGHALTPGGGTSRGGLVMAPDGAGDDGLLEPERILHAGGAATPRVVVLAACSTASGRTSATEGVMSLVRPFLGRGVPTVLASLWPVEDRATAELTRGWAHPPPGGFASALRQCQIEALRGRRLRGAAARAALSFQVFGSTDGPAGPEGTTNHDDGGGSHG